MILILSDFFDSSTESVIEWLIFNKKEYVRINVQDKLEIEYLGKDVLLKTKELSFKLSEINSFWYRRGNLNIENKYLTEISQFDNLQNHELNNLIQFIYYKLGKLKHLNSITNADVNKLIVNEEAKEIGILTPDDYIFSNLISLKNQLSDHSESYITKVLSGRCVQDFEDFSIYNYTDLLTLENVNEVTFFPSLVQNLIEKKYELRIFYLDGAFYPMAIFSQKDNQTNIDFRNYNNEKPNRNVPFKLPRKIENKLNLLMKKLDLNCGSIDMIVTPNNEYVFLEVNPVGQFGMISYPCNYNLEQLISEYL
ncbi:grasp-with-spasm system ATP-grasp peptide maturase [Flavobacterium sp.]|jgi:ATP-GRASP peptide maturase of grasp-with-spasm system|uniref:grasp-with-spasm system ATP-grasp peptide maturase n=1 Tax=Flavobacterium sp. TaxID=239 RepID=UPI0037C0FB39